MTDDPWEVDTSVPVQAAPKAGPRSFWDDVNGALSTAYRSSGALDELSAGLSALPVAAAEAISGQGKGNVWDRVKQGFDDSLAVQRRQQAGYEQAHPVGAALAKDTGLIAPLAATALTGGAAAAPEVSAEAPGLMSTLRGIVLAVESDGWFAGWQRDAREAVMGATGAAGYAAADSGTPIERLNAAGRAVMDPVNAAFGAVTGGLISPAAAKGPKLKGSALDMLKATTAGLETMKNKAYTAVDDLGVAFSPQSARALLLGMTDDLQHAGYKASADTGVKAALDFAHEQLASGLPVTMGTLDRVRQVIGQRTMSDPKDFQAKLGMILRKNVDEFVGSAGPQHMVAQPIPGIGPNKPPDPSVLRDKLAAARDMNSRYMKAEALSPGGRTCRPEDWRNLRRVQHRQRDPAGHHAVHRP